MIAELEQVSTALAAMGAAYCTGRKDDLFYQQTLEAFFGDDPPPAPVVQQRPHWQQEREHLPESPRSSPRWPDVDQEDTRTRGWSSLHPTFDQGAYAHPSFDQDSESEEPELESLDLRLTRLLAAYGSEVHDGHGLLTAADSYYFALLEFQRRHDSVGIQAEAVRRMLDNSEELDAAPWRQRLAEKRAEAVESLADRAKHYAVGRRSSQGLLQITTGANAETTLRSYEELLDKEYELAASEIEATLSTLSAEPEAQRNEHARALLEQLRRSAAFWTSQIEETFGEWQTASIRLNEAQEKRSGAWGLLLPAVRALLDEILSSRRPGFGREYNAMLERACTKCCVRLLELDLHQYAHGLRSTPRRQLLVDLLASVRDDGGMPEVARALLLDPGFAALDGMQVVDTGHGVLDVRSNADHPWASVLAELFGELLFAACRESPRLHVASVRAAEDFLERRSGLEEVRQAAARYARPRTGRTALHQAASTHSMWLCRRLLDLGADPLATDADGSSPLSITEEECLRRAAAQRVPQAEAPNGPTAEHVQ